MADRPNVLLFVPHDTGCHLSPYGIDPVVTPHAERLAAEGVRFAGSFCTTPLCSPSRAALTTGRYPHQNGVMGLTGDRTGAFDLYPDEVHAAAHFAAAGYESVLCGFEHETRDCTRVGFGRTLCGSGKGNNGGGDLRDYGQAIDGWLAGRDARQPFYLQIGCHETHRDWTLHDAEPDESRGVWMPPYLLESDELRREMTELQGAVRRLDDGLGSILAALDRHGVTDDTIVVFTTDHGIDLPRAKGTFFDPGIAVFLFLRYPRAGWGAGRVVDELVSNVDVLPTLLEACGLPRPANLAGQSQLPLLDGRPHTPREAIYAEKTYHDTYDPTRIVRTNRYKYLRHFEVNIFQDLRLATMTNRHYWRDGWLRNSPEELYDLEADPLEFQNVAADPAYASIKATLRTQLRDWMRETTDPLLDGPVPSPFYAAQLREFAG